MAAGPHPSFPQPTDPNEKVWRYMSLTKFVWMLQRGGLYFSRSDSMGDPFEGHYTRPTAENEDGFVAAQMSNPELAKFGDAAFRRQFRPILDSFSEEKKNLFVSCWHLSRDENLAMWKLYAAQHESVCVQSTYLKLHSLLSEDIYLGKVTYIDYEREHIDITNTLNLIMHKRKSFQHEDEVRAVIWTPATSKKFEQCGDKGLFVPVELDRLIETIYVSPTSAAPFEEVITGLKGKYGISAPVVHSSVNGGPSY